LVVGALALLSIALWQKTPLIWRAYRRPATLGAILGISAYQLTFFAAVDRTGVTVGTIVGIGSAPIMGGLLGYLFREEALERRWLIATALAILGCAILTASSGAIQFDGLGLILAIGAGTAYAVYTLASKYLLEELPAAAVVAVVFCGGALMLGPLLFFVPLGWIGQPAGAAVVLHLGLITVGTAYIFFARGLQSVEVGRAVTLTLAEPLTAGLLGALVLREALNLPAGIGIALIFIGLAYLSRKPIE
jgi:DME family drug/metabolite transporter